MDTEKFVEAVCDLSAGTIEKIMRRKGTLFKPYTSMGDGLFRPLSVVTAPIGFGVCAAAITLDAGYELLKAIVNAILLEFDDSKKCLQNSMYRLVAIFGCVLVMIASPAINLVDCLGALIVTINDHGERLINGTTLRRSCLDDENRANIMPK